METNIAHDNRRKKTALMTTRKVCRADRGRHEKNQTHSDKEQHDAHTHTTRIAWHGVGTKMRRQEENKTKRTRV